MKIRGRSIIGGGLYFCWISSGFEEFGLGVLVNHCRGHRVAGGFGHRSQDSLRYLGAREPNRLLGLGRVWSSSREDNQISESLASGRGILFMNLLSYVMIM